MYKSVNGRERIFYLDFIRAIAIILVVLAHVTRQFYQNATLSSYKIFCSPFMDFAVLGVPLFLMISGALLLNRDYEIGSFLKKRYMRVLIPFLFWSIFTIFFKIVFEGQSSGPMSIMELFFNLYWFVWMILGVYLFIPVINSFIKEYGMKGIEYFLVIWAITMFLNTIGQYPFHNLELSYFAGYLGYFVLGYYLSNKNFNISNKYVLIISLIIFLIFTFINIDYTLSKATLIDRLMYYKYLTIVVAIQSAGLYSFLRYFAVIGSANVGSFINKIYLFFKDSFMFKIIFSISTFSYGIYLVHFTPWKLFTWINNHIIPIYTYNPLMWIPLILIAILVISLLILWIFDKIPILRNVNGAH